MSDSSHWNSIATATRNGWQWHIMTHRWPVQSTSAKHCARAHWVLCALQRAIMLLPVSQDLHDSGCCGNARALYQFARIWGCAQMYTQNCWFLVYYLLFKWFSSTIIHGQPDLVAVVDLFEFVCVLELLWITSWLEYPDFEWSSPPFEKNISFLCTELFWGNNNLVVLWWWLVVPHSQDDNPRRNHHSVLRPYNPECCWHLLTHSSLTMFSRPCWPNKP